MYASAGRATANMDPRNTAWRSFILRPYCLGTSIGRLESGSDLPGRTSFRCSNGSAVEPDDDALDPGGTLGAAASAGPTPFENLSTCLSGSAAPAATAGGGPAAGRMSSVTGAPSAGSRFFAVSILIMPSSRI